jgi:nitrogen fixation protein NifX
MRVAFASSDGRAVDQRFGATRRFDIWEVDASNAVAVERIIPGDACVQRDDRMALRARTLDGCALVYATEIGNPAVAKLVRRSIHALRTEQCLPIADAIEALQRVLRTHPPPWLRRAAGIEARPIQSSD